MTGEVIGWFPYTAGLPVIGSSWLWKAGSVFIWFSAPPFMVQTWPGPQQMLNIQ